MTKVTAAHVSVKVFPNPTIGNLNLEITSEKGYTPSQVVVINSAGNIVFKMVVDKMQNGRIELQLPNTLPAGVYLVSALNKSYYSEPIKFILQK